MDRPKAGPDIVEKLRGDLSHTFPDTPAILVADIIAFLTRITDKVGTLFNWVALIVSILAILVSAGRNRNPAVSLKRSSAIENPRRVARTNIDRDCHRADGHRCRSRFGGSYNW